MLYNKEEIGKIRKGWNDMDPKMEEKLKEYARLLVRVGLNVEQGQTLVISSPVECAFFARLCAAVAYEYCALQWGGRYAGWSAPARCAFLLAVPFGLGIAACGLLAWLFHRKAKRAE